MGKKDGTRVSPVEGLDNNEVPPKKAKCPVTRDRFRAKAPQTLTVVIDGQAKVATIKEFGSGSLGWYLNDKIDVLIDGVPCKVQVGANFTIVGSKELPEG